MDKTQEALHKALKVLNCLNNDRVYETAWVKGAINACEEALAQPAQEPVAQDRLELVEDNGNGIKTYRILPAPSFIGLSDDEIETLIPDTTAFKCEVSVDECIDFARAIEQALKEKNNAT